jgi:hypothetical protein
LADEANNLQRQLANLDASIQTRGQDISREGLSLQNNLANLDASTRIYLGDLSAQMQQQGFSTQERLARLDAELRALRAQLGNRGLDLQYDQLGGDMAWRQAQLNRDALLAGMGG